MSFCFLILLLLLDVMQQQLLSCYRMHCTASHEQTGLMLQVDCLARRSSFLASPSGNASSTEKYHTRWSAVTCRELINIRNECRSTSIGLAACLLACSRSRAATLPSSGSRSCFGSANDNFCSNFSPETLYPLESWKTAKDIMMLSWSHHEQHTSRMIPRSLWIQ